MTALKSDAIVVSIRLSNVPETPLLVQPASQGPVQERAPARRLVQRASTAVAVLSLLMSVASGCGRSSSKPKPSTHQAAEAPDKDRVVSGEGFAWGEVDDDGLSVGLRIVGTEARAGKRLRYFLALHNQTDQERRITLFNDVERGRGRRLQLFVREKDGQERAVGMAAGWDEASSGNLGISMVLGPGQKKERSGKPIRLTRDLAGTQAFFLRFGGPSFDFDLTSKPVAIDVRPAQ